MAPHGARAASPMRSQKHESTSATAFINSGWRKPAATCIGQAGQCKRSDGLAGAGDAIDMPTRLCQAHGLPCL